MFVPDKTKSFTFNSSTNHLVKMRRA